MKHVHFSWFYLPIYVAKIRKGSSRLSVQRHFNGAIAIHPATHVHKSTVFRSLLANVSIHILLLLLLLLHLLSAASRIQISSPSKGAKDIHHHHDWNSTAQHPSIVCRIYKERHSETRHDTTTNTGVQRTWKALWLDLVKSFHRQVESFLLLLPLRIDLSEDR